eukprot:jgi/Mesvir1/11152/Mv04594-RA.1
MNKNIHSNIDNSSQSRMASRTPFLRLDNSEGLTPNGPLGRLAYPLWFSERRLNSRMAVSGSFGENPSACILLASSADIVITRSGTYLGTSATIAKGSLSMAL